MLMPVDPGVNFTLLRQQVLPYIFYHVYVMSNRLFRAEGMTAAR